MKFFSSNTRPTESAEAIIQETLRFLLERNERRFTNMLRTQLLTEGCNYPPALARPRFYALMRNGLREKSTSRVQDAFVAAFPQETLSHEEFYAVIRFFLKHLEQSGKIVALEVINSIQRLSQDALLTPLMFQENPAQFQARIETIMNELWQAAAQDEAPAPPAFALVRRRLYMSFVTALLSKISARNAFEREFGSIPEALGAMQAEHATFCRFMEFCRERSPYVQLLASQTFWRTLEALRLEQAGVRKHAVHKA